MEVGPASHRFLGPTARAPQGEPNFQPSGLQPTLRTHEEAVVGSRGEWLALTCGSKVISRLEHSRTRPLTHTCYLGEQHV